MKKRSVSLAIALLMIATACGSDDSTTSDVPEIPDEIAAVTDDWYAAADQGDGSVIDLYTSYGYHLYGDQRIEREDIAVHLQGGGFEHEWITEPMLIVDEGDGRYVVVRGMRNTHPTQGSDASAVMFEIMTTDDGEYRLQQTAWFYETEGDTGE